MPVSIFAGKVQKKRSKKKYKEYESIQLFKKYSIIDSFQLNLRDVLKRINVGLYFKETL